VRHCSLSNWRPPLPQRRELVPDPEWPPGSVFEADVNKQPTADNSDFAGMYTSDLKQVSYMTTFTLVPLTDAGFVAVGS